MDHSIGSHTDLTHDLTYQFSVREYNALVYKRHAICQITCHVICVVNFSTRLESAGPLYSSWCTWVCVEKRRFDLESESSYTCFTVLLIDTFSAARRHDMHSYVFHTYYAYSRVYNFKTLGKLVQNHQEKFTSFISVANF